MLGLLQNVSSFFASFSEIRFFSNPSNIVLQPKGYPLKNPHTIMNELNSLALKMCFNIG